MPAESFGPYVVYEQIGLGGMATVHRAETQGIAGFSKQVALKRMLPSVAADASLVKSFIREARLASLLRHGNVAQTYDLGKVGEIYFIAMELVKGRNLRQILKHCAGSGVRIPLPIAMNIVNQIADALDYAHNLCDESGQPLGIIHRDVSPSNVIVSEGGIVKLIDFGIAKASGSMATMSGTIKGKFGYMAPEYLEGFIDARADLFALGVIAHELLSNKPLFQGRDDMDTLFRVKDMAILPPSRLNPLVPPEIDAIVMTALERDPNKRWQRAQALRAALTSETQRLGLSALNQQVIEWVEQTFDEGDHEPEISISGGTTELPKGSNPQQSIQDVDWKAPSDAMTRKANAYEEEAMWKQASQDFPTALHRPTGRAATPKPNEFSDSDDVKTIGYDANATVSYEDVLKRGDRSGKRPSQPPPQGSMFDRPKQSSQPPAPVMQTTPQGRSMFDRPSPQPRRDTPVPVAQPGSRTQPENVVNRPLTPVPAAPAHEPAPMLSVPSGARTFPQMQQQPQPQMPHYGQPLPPQLPPLGSVPSGARTLPHMPHGGTLLGVGESQILHEQRIAEAAASGSMTGMSGRTDMPTRVEPEGKRRASNFLLAVLVLIVAGGAAAVVYFALPYLT